MTDKKTKKPAVLYFDRSNPTPDWGNPPQDPKGDLMDTVEIINNPYDEKEKAGMTTPTGEEIKGAMPAKPAQDANPEQKQAYYKELEAVGMKLLKGFFAENHHDNLTARRPFSGLKTTEYYSDAQKMKNALWPKKKDGREDPFKARSPEIGHGVQLASQEIWLGKSGIPNLEKLTWEEKFALIRWKNEDLKKEVLKEYLTATDDKRTVKNLKAAMTRGETKKAKKTETEKEKAAPKAKAQPAVEKAKTVVGKKEVDALIKQVETAEKELTKAKADFDKAMDKVKQAHGKLREELTVNRRLISLGE
jgi:hypothetical protein